MNSFLNQLPVFEANQVLTSSQLNSMVDYLDQQNRITRVNLVGTGIVCGLELLKNSTGTRLTITKGMGVTSNGYLISLGEDRAATHYRKYNLPAGVRYTPFEDPNNGNAYDADNKLFELLTDDVTPFPSDIVNPITSTTDFDLSDMVVMLFLEVVDVDLQSCLGKACDEHGKQRVYNLRKLLVDKTYMDSINERINTQTVPFENKFSQANIFPKKPMFVTLPSGTNDHLKTYNDFSLKFKSALIAAVKPTGISSAPGDPHDPPLQDTLAYIDKIFAEIENTFAVFRPLLTPVYGASPFIDSDYTTPKGKITDFVSGTFTSGRPTYFGIQYVYDFLNDLVNAFNEFNAYAFELLEECFQNMDSFPNHLMLGEYNALNTSIVPVYRQYQATSPLLNNQSIKADAAIFYHKRMMLMINMFDITLINQIAAYNTNELATNAVLLTPTSNPTNRLSKSAIPYYYKINDTFTRTFNSLTYFQTKLVDQWNYNHKIKRSLTSQGLLPASYWNQDYTEGVDRWVNKTPLYYLNDESESFRIEGHLGKDHTKVKTRLEKIRTDFGLPFNVVSIRLKGDSETDFTALYNFDDLRTEYGSLRAQLIALVDNLLLVFPVVIPSTTPRTFIPAFIDNVIASSYDKAVDNGSIALPSYGNVSSSTRSWNNMRLSFNTNMDAFITLLDTLKGTSKLPYNLASMDIGYSDNGTEGDGFIQCYKNSLLAAKQVKEDINQLLDSVIRNWSTPYNNQFYTVFSTYINEKLRWIDNFISDAKFKAIILTHYKYRYRITQLKLNDPELLSNFIQKHPGLEHTGTVKKGGTIVLVRNGGNTDEEINSYNLKPQQVIADFSLPYLASTEINANTITPEANDTTGFTLPASGTPVLIFPTFTMPLYLNYHIGDFAFAPDKTISDVANGYTSTELIFSIVPQLIFDPAFGGVGGTNIYLYLFDQDGTRVARDGSNNTELHADGIKSIITTSDYCNPRASIGGVKAATAKIKREGGVDHITYSPSGGVNSYGVDSFYYMFEIVAEDGVLVAKSGIGQITVNIDYHPA